MSRPGSDAGCGSVSGVNTRKSAPSLAAYPPGAAEPAEAAPSRPPRDTGFAFRLREDAAYDGGARRPAAAAGPRLLPPAEFIAPGFSGGRAAAVAEAEAEAVDPAAGGSRTRVGAGTAAAVAVAAVAACTTVAGGGVRAVSGTRPAVDSAAFKSPTPTLCLFVLRFLISAHNRHTAAVRSQTHTHIYIYTHIYTHTSTHPHTQRRVPTAGMLPLHTFRSHSGPPTTPHCTTALSTPHQTHTALHRNTHILTHTHCTHPHTRT